MADAMSVSLMTLGRLFGQHFTHVRLFEPIGSLALARHAGTARQPFSSSHARFGWFSQTQPMPKQLGSQDQSLRERP